MSITIEEGKRYVRRDGVVSGVIEKDPYDESTFTFKDPTTGHWYTENGSYWWNSRSSPYDLIKEYHED